MDINLETAHQLGLGIARGEGCAITSFGCLNFQLGLVLMANAPTRSLTRSRSDRRGDIIGSSGAGGDESLLLRSLSVFLLRSRGNESESVVGVSQELLSDSTDRECELFRFFSFRRLASTPSWGELNPMFDSSGRSEGLGSLLPPPLVGVVGDEQLEARAKGELPTPRVKMFCQGSAVRGVPSVGVDKRGSPLGNGSGVLIESTSLGDLREARQLDISWNSRNLGVLSDSLGVVRQSWLGENTGPSLMAALKAF